MSRYPSLIWCLSGLLFGAAFLHSWLAPLVIPAFWLYLRALATATLSARHIFCYSWLLGSIKTALVLSWFWSTYPLTWLIDTSVSLQIILISFYWLTAAIAIGLGLALATTSLYHLRRYTPHYLYAIPLAWLGGEILGSVFFSILTLGPGSTINLYFSYGYLGYILAAVPVVQSIAVFGGAYALTLFFTGLMTSLYAYWQSARRLGTITLTGSICTIVIVGASYLQINQLNAITQHVTVINTSFSKFDLKYPDGHEQRSEQLMAAITEAGSSVTDVIILPEDARFSTAFDSADAVFDFLAATQAGDVILIDSVRSRTTDGVVLRALTFDTSDRTLYTQDKNYLVPQGEYLPYAYDQIIKRIVDETTYQKLSHNLSYRPGEPLETPLPTAAPAILFCMESTTPFAATHLKKTNPPFIAHLISHAWFNTPHTLWYQQDSMLRTQALWSQTPIVTASNQAPDTHYTSNGQRIELTPYQQSDTWRILHTNI